MRWRNPAGLIGSDRMFETRRASVTGNNIAATREIACEGLVKSRGRGVPVRANVTILGPLPELMSWRLVRGRKRNIAPDLRSNIATAQGSRDCWRQDS
jgi:hypothetical protein